MFPLENRIGLYIFQSKLQFVELQFTNNEYVLTHLDEAYFDEEIDFAADKETKILNLMQSAFNEILARHEIHSSSLFIALPTEFFSVIKAPFDNTLLRQDLLLQFQWDLSVSFPQLPVGETSIQYHELENDSTQGTRRAVVLGISRKLLKLMKNFAQKNNFQLQLVDFAHFACDCSLKLNYPKMQDGDYLSILLTDAMLSLEVISSGKTVYIKTRRLHNAGEAAAIIEEELNDLPNYGLSKDKLISAFAFGEFITPNFLTALEQRIGLKLYPVNPFKQITIHPSLADSKLLRERFHTFAPAAGACYRLA